MLQKLQVTFGRGDAKALIKKFLRDFCFMKVCIQWKHIFANSFSHRLLYGRRHHLIPYYVKCFLFHDSLLVSIFDYFVIRFVTNIINDLFTLFYTLFISVLEPTIVMKTLPFFINRNGSSSSSSFMFSLVVRSSIANFKAWLLWGFFIPSSLLFLVSSLSYSFKNCSCTYSFNLFEEIILGLKKSP